MSMHDMEPFESAGVGVGVVGQGLDSWLASLSWADRLTAIQDLWLRVTPSQRTIPLFGAMSQTSPLGQSDLYAAAGPLDLLVPTTGRVIADARNDANTPNTRSLLQGLVVVGARATIMTQQFDAVTGNTYYAADDNLQKFLGEALSLSVYPVADEQAPMVYQQSLRSFMGPNGGPIRPFVWSDDYARISIVRSRYPSIGAGSPWGYIIPGLPANAQNLRIYLAVEIMTLAFNMATKTLGSVGVDFNKLPGGQ